MEKNMVCEKQRLVATLMPPTGDRPTTQACALPGYRTGNRGLQATAQSTEPHQSGLSSI